MKKLVNIEDANILRLEKIRRITGLTTDTAVINLAIYEFYMKLWDKQIEMSKSK